VLREAFSGAIFELKQSAAKALYISGERKAAGASLQN
jgi:hypothetical protein